MTTASSPVRPYLGQPAEDRVRNRRSRLLDTALGLLASEGWREVTIDSLCRKARLNKRYFYESFSDLDELAAALVDELADGLASAGFGAVWVAREAGLPTDELAREAIAAVVEFATDDPRRARVLFSEIPGSPRALERRRAAVHRLADALSVYGYEHHQARGTDALAELTAALLVGGSAEAIIAWLDGNIEMSRERLIDDLVALWVLAGDGAAARARARHSRSRLGRS